MGAIKDDELAALTEVTRALTDKLTLEQMLQLIADTAAALTGTDRASVRLLDPTGTRLIAAVRAGTPLHENALKDFQLGEGLIGWVARTGKVARVPDAPADPRFMIRVDQAVEFRSFLGVPLMAGRVCLGVLSTTHEEADRFDQHHESLVQLLAGICSPHVEIARLSRLSTVDPLTGALNRRGLDLVLPEHGPSANDEPLAILLVDIDHFKKLNDTYGHAVGDEALRRVSQILGSVLRRGDAVIRMGGEEFLMVLPGLEMARAARVAERARASVKSAAILMGELAIPVTISVGVAEKRAGESRENLLRRADSAMYEAKRNGRNRVEAAR